MYRSNLLSLTVNPRKNNVIRDRSFEPTVNYTTITIHSNQIIHIKHLRLRRLLCHLVCIRNYFLIIINSNPFIDWYNPAEIKLLLMASG